MKVVSVIPLKKGIPVGNLAYFTALSIPEGHVVSVPIKNKKILALVSKVEELSEAKGNIKNMNFNLRKVAEDKGPSIFQKEFISATLDAAEYFVEDKGLVITCLIPNIFMEDYDKISEIIKKIKKEMPQNIATVPIEIKPEKLLFQAPLEDRISAYKTMIRESFARGKSVFIICGTETCIEIFSEALSKGIGEFAFAMHSGINKKKNMKNCQKILSSTHPVLIVGTTPFLAIPRNDLGTVILEEENGNGYIPLGQTHLDFRIFAEIFASKMNARFIMSSDLLRFETIARKDTENINPLHPLSFRTDLKIKMEILSQKSEKNKWGGFKVLKEESMLQVFSALREKKNVFIFSLRKGLSTMTVCRDCGNTVSCGECESVLVLYTSKDGKKRMFVCNKCGAEKNADILCDVCGGWNLIPLGIGIETVLEYLRESLGREKDLGKTKIFKLDRESAGNKNGAKKIAEGFSKSSGAILVGTEMALYYLREKVPLSVIASFDSLWSIPNFKMGEKILRILLDISDKTEEKLIIQVKNIQDKALLALKEGNLWPLIREDIENRKILHYPPFKRFIKTTFLGKKSEVLETRERLKEIFKEYEPEIFSGFIPRIKDKYSANMLLKINPERWSLPSLLTGGNIDRNLSQKLRSLPRNFKIKVDPEDLL